MLIAVSRTSAAPAPANPWPWVDISSALIQAKALPPAFPGGCSGVVVNRLNGDVTMKVVGNGLWRSSDKGKTWRRIDDNTVSGRDETGWATSVDQNDPRRMASFSLDGLAGWTLDGDHWKSFTNNGRNWDYGSIDWATAVPKTILMAKHETNPPGEMDLSTDGGVTWKVLGVRVGGNRDKAGMVGVMDANTLIYSSGEGINRSTDTGATWTHVSDTNPLTRIPVLFKGVHYLGTAAGLLVSKDKGATWTPQGAPVNIRIGPFFGADETKIVVMGDDGIFQTNDAGTTWQKVAPLKVDEKGYSFHTNWFGCYAWDPIGHALYASSMGNPAYRTDIGKE